MVMFISAITDLEKTLLVMWLRSCGKRKLLFRWMNEMLLIIILKLLCVWNLKTKLLRARRDFMFVMNILSYNIRGCGSFLKRKRLVNLIRKEDFDMCLIQETEAKVIDDNLVVALQGNKDVKCS